MYDAEKRVELVKKRVHEKYRRKKRRGICRLSALCTALSAFLVGTVHTAAGQTQITARECTALSCYMKMPAVMCWWG